MCRAVYSACTRGAEQHQFNDLEIKYYYSLPLLCGHSCVGVITVEREKILNISNAAFMSAASCVFDTSHLIVRLFEVG